MLERREIHIPLGDPPLHHRTPGLPTPSQIIRGAQRLGDAVVRDPPGSPSCHDDPARLQRFQRGPAPLVRRAKIEGTRDPPEGLVVERAPPDREDPKHEPADLRYPPEVGRDGEYIRDPREQARRIVRGPVPVRDLQRPIALQAANDLDDDLWDTAGGHGEPLEEPYLLPPTNGVRNPARWNVPEVRLEEDEHYVIGDNRSMRQDDHYFGIVGRDRIVGRLMNP